MHRSFWEQNPALLLGATLLISTSSILYWDSPWNWVFPLLWCGYLLSLKNWGALALLAGGLLYGQAAKPPLLPAGERAAYFSLSSVQPYSSPFHKGFLYKGTIHVSEGSAPCSVVYLGESRPLANSDLLLYGRLVARDNYSYAFKPKYWTPVEGTWSLAELRYQSKEWLRSYLKQKLTHPKTAAFLGSLLTGDVDDRSLKFDFARLGLQHILAISGFHFAVLIAFCTFFLNFLFPNRWKYVILLIAIHLYFLFVGSMPAIQRSWIAAELYLIGKLIGRNTTGLNLLGLALLVEMMLDPLSSSQLGFQLSFLSCFGILLFQPLFEKALRRLLPKRDASEFLALPAPLRHVSLLSSFLRQSLAVSCAVNLAILPLLFYHFHRFPLLSLFYNLFFPFLVGLALFLLLLSLLCPPLFPLTDLYTAQLLDLASYPPLPLDYSLKLSSLPAWSIPFYLYFLFLIANNFFQDLTNRLASVRISRLLRRS